ncbi:MAG: MFS transporter, partial [Bacteroidota bacterium]
FIWVPIVDLSLSLNKWYLIAVSLCSISLLSIILVPLDVQNKAILMVVVFISQVAGAFSSAPLGGFMAKLVKDSQKGRASGMYQAGNLGGIGIGGGLGLWITEHYSYLTALLLIVGLCSLCTCTLFFLPKISAIKGDVKRRFKIIVLDLKGLFSNKISIYTTILMTTPIAVGAVASMWSSIADQWNVLPDTTALITGVLSAILSVLGCIVGGFICDKFSRWTGFFGSGITLGLIAIIMAFTTFNNLNFCIGVLVYAFILGIGYASFSAVIIHAIGKENASTKYTFLSSLGNVPLVYLLALNGYIADNYNIKYMLVAEALLGIGFAIIFLGILWKMGFPTKTVKLDTLSQLEN